MKVLTIGETLASFQPKDHLSLKMSQTLSASIAGAESNVAISLSRLGVETSWLSCVGQDEFGERILATLRSEQVKTHLVKKLTSHSTGVFFKHFKGYGETNVLYYRSHSAATQLSQHFQEFSWLEGVDLVHLTGITLAISAENAKFIIELAKELKKRQIILSFDPNLRLKLWTLDQAKFWIEQLLPYCDWYFPSEVEFIKLHGDKSPKEVVKEYELTCLTLKEGLGATAYTDSEVITYQGAPAAHILDTAGAGDAFVAGMLYSILNHDFSTEGVLIKKALQIGHEMGKIAVQTQGDWENLPTEYELTTLMAEGHQDLR